MENQVLNSKTLTTFSGEKFDSVREFVIDKNTRIVFDWDISNNIEPGMFYLGYDAEKVKTEFHRVVDDEDSSEMNEYIKNREYYVFCGSNQILYCPSGKKYYLEDMFYDFSDDEIQAIENYFYLFKDKSVDNDLLVIEKMWEFKKYFCEEELFFGADCDATLFVEDLESSIKFAGIALNMHSILYMEEKAKRFFLEKLRSLSLTDKASIKFALDNLRDYSEFINPQKILEEAISKLPFKNIAKRKYEFGGFLPNSDDPYTESLFFNDVEFAGTKVFLAGDIRIGYSNYGENKGNYEISATFGVFMDSDFKNGLHPKNIALTGWYDQENLSWHFSFEPY